MSSTSNNSSKIIGLVLLLAALAGIAYYFLAGKSENATETPATAEQTTPSTEPQTEAALPVTEETSEPKQMVIETKTLNVPAAATPSIPVSAVSTDPAVEEMMGLRKMGLDSAPIKVVEYSSLTCGHCSSFHKNDLEKIKTDYIDTGKVQFIFKEFPLNKPAVDASKLLRCMPEDKFLPFMSLLFNEQEKWAYQPDYLGPLKQNAKLAGLSEKQIDDCLANKALEDRIVGDMKAASDKYKIQSTPTFIVNDGIKTIVGHQQIGLFEETFKDILNGSAPVTMPIEQTKE